MKRILGWISRGVMFVLPTALQLVAANNHIPPATVAVVLDAIEKHNSPPQETPQDATPHEG